MSVTCCYNCPDRAPACHGVCERYREQRRAEKDAKARIREPMDLRDRVMYWGRRKRRAR